MAAALNMQTIKVLLVEDDAIDSLAFMRHVKQAALPYDYTIVTSLAEAQTTLDLQSFHIAILDYNLGDGTALELFEQVKAKNLPFIIATGSGDEETAALLMYQGAYDYLIKDPARQYLKVLAATVNKAIDRKQSEDQIRMLTQAMQGMRDSIYIIDDAGNLAFINQALSEICGLSIQAAIAQPIDCLGQPELTRHIAQSAECRDILCNQEVDLTLMRRDGSTVAASLSESFIQDGSRSFKVGVIRDITALKQIELALRSAQESLEEQVDQRTQQLQKSNDDLLEEIRERHKAETALRTSTALIQQQRAFLRSVIDGDPNLIFVKDRNGRYLLANQAMAESYGLTVEELVGKRDIDINPSLSDDEPNDEPDDERFLQENYQVIENQQELFLPEETVYREGIGEEWRQWQKRPIQLPDSETIGVLGVGVNITSRKQIEFALLESERLFASLAQSAPVGIFRTDLAGNCVYVNERWCQITGLTPDEALLGPRWIQALHPDDRDAITTEWHQSLRAGRPFRAEYRFQQADGTITWVVGQALVERDANGEITGHIGTITDISDRKRSEDALRASEAYQRALIRSLPDLIMRIDQDGNYLEFIAPPTFRVVGNSKEFIGTTIFENIPSHLVPQRMEAVQAALQTGAIQFYEQDLSTQDKIQIEEVRVVPYGEREVLLLVRDISDRKQAEEDLRQLNQSLEERVKQRTAKLQEREAELRDFFDNATDLIQSLAPDGRILFVNRAWRETLGYTEQEIQHLSITQILHPNQVRSWMEMMQDVLNGNPYQTVETTFITQEGKEIIVEGNINCRFDQDTVIATRGIFRDITARKRAEYALRSSEQRYATLTSMAPVGIFRADAQGNCLYVNERWCEMTGLSLVDAAGLGWMRALHPDDRTKYTAEWKRVTQDGDAFRLEYRFQQPQGTIVWVFGQAVQERELDGSLIGYVATVTDISERKQAEAQLERTNQELARATRLKDEFLANMSHELRTPLNAILGMTEGLQEQVFGPINLKQLKALQTVESSGSHLLELINDILDLSKIEAGQIELDYSSNSVEHLCQTSLAFIKQQALQKRIQLDIRLQPNLPDLCADERRIRQVLINLLNNAVKFTPEGGRVILEVIQLPNVAPPSALSPAFLRIAVRDTGIGISAEDIAKLFQPFVQIDSALNRQYQGTGLGLALVKQITELHGGRVGLTSELGLGSCFTIELPCRPNPAALPDLTIGNPPTTTAVPDISWDNPACDSTTRPTPKILLAEDNEANISTISSYLGAKGYCVLLAKQGQEAVELAKIHQPDLIVMDIQMPGMDGLEATRQIRLDPDIADVPIIALTALAMTGDRERCLEAGANDYLTKPVKLKQLATTIQALLTVREASP